MRVVDDDTFGALNIYAEARGEVFEGQVAVGNVVRERMRLQYASDGTVVGTVWRPNQFSWTKSGDEQRIRVLEVDDQSPAWQRALQAWRESATRSVVPEGTVLYHNTKVQPYWTRATTVVFVDQIGNHLFYRDTEAG